MQGLELRVRHPCPHDDYVHVTSACEWPAHPCPLDDYVRDIRLSGVRICGIGFEDMQNTKELMDLGFLIPGVATFRD